MKRSGRVLQQVPALLAEAERLLAAGDATGALRLADQAVAADPHHPNAPVQRGLALSALGRHLDAAASFDAALALCPGMAPLWLLAGNARRAAGNEAAAVDCYRRCVALAPELAGAWYNLGLALRADGQEIASARALRRACALEPGRASHWNALGAALHAAAAYEQAARAFALSLRHAAGRDVVTERRARWNMAQLDLLQGRMQEGWRNYPYRPSGPFGGQMRDLPLPLLTGVPTEGMRLLVLVDQGLGDIIMAARFLPLLARRGVRVTMQRPAPLRRLLTAESLPGIAFLDEGMELPALDACISCMELPALFVDGADHVPGEKPYLRADAGLARRWAERLHATSGPRVGFVWAGNPQFTNDRARSPGIAALLPLIRLPGITPVLVQCGPGRRELEGLALPSGVIDAGLELTDLAETAALLSQLDLLVSSCTMPAHLAGALGRPVALLLSHVPDWRWQLGRDDTPWYPSVRLYRQNSPGDWTGPVQAVASDLAEAQA